MRTANHARPHFLTAGLIWSFARRLAVPVSVMVCVLVACDDYVSENHSAEQYRSWAGAQSGVSVSVVRNRDDNITVILAQIHNTKSCTDLYSDTIKEFGNMIVFQSLDGEELHFPDTIERQIFNPILMADDATPEKWAKYCAQMITSREQFTGCTLPETTQFNVGIWTDAHFDEGSFEEMADRAERFNIGPGYAVGLRNDKSRQSECQAGAE